MEKCLRCGHKWEPRQPEPITCPRCKSYKWQTMHPNALKTHVKPVLSGDRSLGDQNHV
jgi:hypothetical protein